ncbi:hypothetical protein SAMN04488137_3586 [Fictibacillus solisalsi]|uniref:Uncharacterized protein n=1 Tax=Fictibacillus solisalsi TaxID=459525 RepID=A0A1G9YQ28_9BACL|nr:hypothetical protein SAMN04488137_3586 [Fictibacillus solisalsi]
MKKEYTYYNTGPEDLVVQFLPISIVVAWFCSSYLSLVFLLNFFESKKSI